MRIGSNRTEDFRIILIVIKSSPEIKVKNHRLEAGLFLKILWLSKVLIRIGMRPLLVAFS